MTQETQAEQKVVQRERRQILRRMERWMEMPMVILGLGWLVLLIIDLTGNLSPALQMVSNVIWVLFILEFLLKFTLAPTKLRFLRRNVLTLIALALPALRIFRIFRAIRLLRVARATRGVRLVRVVTSINRGMRALGNTMQRRGFGYVVATTAIVTFAGAAGMYAFERNPAGGPGLNDYGSALWWTAMIMTALGSDYWPQTAEGRLLCLALSLYALGILGYVTATLASFFLGRDAADDKAEVAGAPQIEALRNEIALLRQEIQKLHAD